MAYRIAPFLITLSDLQHCVVGVGRGQSDQGRTRARKVGRNRKVLGWCTNFGWTFLEFRSSDFAKIFSTPRGGGTCRGAKKFRNLAEFRENRGQSTPRSKISTPLITPKWGGRSPPNKICFYQGSQAYNEQWPVRGWQPPRGVNSKSRNRPKQEINLGQSLGAPPGELGQ